MVSNGGHPAAPTLQIPSHHTHGRSNSAIAADYSGSISLIKLVLFFALRPFHLAEMERSYTSAVPLIEADAMAQFLGAHGDHCFTYEQMDESMEAMAAMFLPGLDTDSNSSSGCLNYDVPPQCWPQHGHSSSVTSFPDPAHSYGSFEFPVMDPFPIADLDAHCAIPYLTEDLISPPHGNHPSARVEEATKVVTPVATKRKSSAAMTVCPCKYLNRTVIYFSYHAVLFSMPNWIDELIQASKKSKKAGKKDPIGSDEGGNTYIDTQSSSSCTSEEGNLEGNAKPSSKKMGTRANRGAATDPQSLYARVSTNKIKCVKK